MTDKEKHLKTLEDFYKHHYKYDCGDYSGIGDDVAQAIKYAIESIKTDLKYDLMYEGEEVYTKDNMVAMLEEIQSGIREIEEDMCIRDSKAEMGFYRLIKDSDVEHIIQEKINKLKGEL